jgi:hypothetical protein
LVKLEEKASRKAAIISYTPNVWKFKHPHFYAKKQREELFSRTNNGSGGKRIG